MGTEIHGNRLIKYGGSEQDYRLPEGISEIGELAFSGAHDLICADISGCSGSIGNYAFMNCHMLQSVKMPSSVNRIGSGLFQNCWMLVGIALPEGVETLGGEMFESCHSLRSVRLPDSLAHVERSAFNNCRSLRQIHISPERMEVLPAPLRNIAVLTYMSAHSGDRACDQVDGYAAEKQRLLLDLAVNQRNNDAVRYMLKRGIASDETIRAILKKSAAAGRVEITALLLDHSRRAMPPDDAVLSGDPFL